MGSFFAKPALCHSPNDAIHFLKKNLIDVTDQSIKLDITNYSKNQIINQLNNYSDKLGNHISTIIGVLNHDEFKDKLPEDQPDIYFINTKCDSILHIHNSSNKPIENILAINIDVLEKHQ